MLKIMANAPVGDDVFGDDPSVNRLEEYVAGFLGKEAAIFMPSGTMTNQVAIKCHTRPGDEILIDANAHIYYYEAGGPAALSGVMCRLLDGRKGIFTAGDIGAALRPDNVHFPRTSLLCVENTHNRGGGSVWPIESIREVTAAARASGLSTHLDGARLWNASVASGVAESEYAAHFDSVSVCFSKGLGAPVGSVLAGTRDLIALARRYRKLFGGGMRQAGILAAAARYALENNRARLAEDHENARELALGLASIPGIRVDPESVETNMVYFELENLPAPEIAAKLTSAGVWVMAVDGSNIRAVLNLMVHQADISIALDIIRKTISYP
jgi:threonine aldolase